MFALLSRCNVLELPLDVQLELFDTMVVPIITYGCETWGVKNNDIIEKLHLRFCRYILKVKNSTPKCMLYGELGRYPVDIHIKCKIIMYWHRLVNGSTNKMSYLMYNVLLSLYREDTYRAEWLSYIHKTLNECEMSDVWLTQGAFISSNQLKELITTRLKDQFKQDWAAEMELNSKCILYKSFKTNLKFEKYLSELNGSHRRLIIRFRLCNHKLAVERGRYTNIVRDRRYCDICTEDVLGDEFHTLMECKNVHVKEFRKVTIQKHIQSVNMYNFTHIMSNVSENCTLATDIGKYLAMLTKRFSCI